MLLALTGATGFIGRHLLQELPKRGYRVRVLLRRPTSVPIPPPAPIAELFIKPSCPQASRRRGRSRTMATARRASAIATSGFFVEDARRKSRQPRNGHTDPGRPVSGLVGNFVGGLLDQEEIKECASSGTAARVRRLPIGAQEGAGSALAKL